MTTNYKEGLGFARFVMVLCSFALLFIHVGDQGYEANPGLNPIKYIIGVQNVVFCFE